MKGLSNPTAEVMRVTKINIVLEVLRLTQITVTELGQGAPPTCSYGGRYKAGMMFCRKGKGQLGHGSALKPGSSEARKAH